VNKKPTAHATNSGKGVAVAVGVAAAVAVALLRVLPALFSTGKSYKNKYPKNGCCLELASQSVDDHNEERIAGYIAAGAFNFTAIVAS